MPAKCVQCGSTLAPGSRVCRGCGRQLSKAVRSRPSGRRAAPRRLPAPKKAVVWGVGLAALVVVFALYHRSQESLGPGPSAPPAAAPKPAAAPPPPPVNANDRNALAANVLSVISLRDDVAILADNAAADDPLWRGQFETKTQQLQAAVAAGQQYLWPPHYQTAQDSYRAALTDYGFAAAHWPAALEPAGVSDDSSGSPDSAPSADQAGVPTAVSVDAVACALHMKTGDVSLKRMLAALDLAGVKTLTPQDVAARLNAPPKPPQGQAPKPTAGGAPKRGA